MWTRSALALAIVFVGEKRAVLRRSEHHVRRCEPPLERIAAQAFRPANGRAGSPEGLRYRNLGTARAQDTGQLMETTTLILLRSGS
jgi:hypothetical protein